MSTVQITQDYYNSTDADEFYYSIWGGEDIHIGIYDTTIDIRQASRLTVEKMASLVAPTINEDTVILDLGSGYGGAARYLASRFRCSVICLNLSEVENKRNRTRNDEENLAKYITVIEGSYEEIPPAIAERSIDIVWSQDAMLHSAAKPKIFEEVQRILKDKGHFIFTDPMQSNTADTTRLQPVYDRIHLKEMASFDFYKDLALKNQFTTLQIIDLSSHLPLHYRRVLEELEKKETELQDKISHDYIANMKTGLQHWIDAGGRGDLSWGILLMQKA